MTALDPGKVLVHVRHAHDAGLRVEVSSQRPDLTTVLRERQADAAVQLVPLLYALCGRAQGAAARLALAAARGQAQSEVQVDAAIAAEAAREHAWRLCLDWPELLGREADKPGFAELIKVITTRQIHDWAIPDWIADLPTESAPVAALPAMDATQSLAAWPRFDAEFALHPTWQGASAETGVGARHPALAAKGVHGRILARAIELQQFLAGQANALGRTSAVQVAPGIGRALVETARGLLMHEITLDGENIAQYVVVAPTEWNFHPRGPLAQIWHGRAMVSQEETEAALRVWVMALDPCVPWTVEWAL